MHSVEQSIDTAKLRGVNLGGWLVLEKWITPSLFDGLDATDETAYCVELGQEEATRRLHAHWNSFITREDFGWLADCGINAVRLPIGHWVLGPGYPYHPAYKEVRYPYVEGGIEVVDKVLDWAHEFNLRVLLDLHAAPGCQNGFDNGGILGVCEWHTKDEYIDYTLDVLERLAQRYGQHPALSGIQSLNEPSWDISTDILKQFQLEAYRRIRRHCPAERVTFVFHDGFRSFREYEGFLQAPEFQNVAIDIHRYQCFSPGDRALDIFGHMMKAAVEWRNEADEMIRDSGYQVYCAEWSLGLDLKVVSLWSEGPFNHALEQMDEFQLAAAYRGYAASQVLTFEKYAGWFFWTYRTETSPDWNYRVCVEQGFFPHMGKPETLAAVKLELQRAKDLNA